MSRNLWRFAAALLFVAAGLPTIAIAPASAAPAAPDAPTFNCPSGTNPRVCAVVQLAEDAYILGGLTAITGLDFGGALAALGSLAELRSLGYGGVMDLQDLDPCDQPWWDNSTCTNPAQTTKENVKKALQFWAGLAQDVKEAYKLAETCDQIGWWFECEVQVEPVAGGNDAMGAYPGGALYTGRADALEWGWYQHYLPANPTPIGDTVVFGVLYAVSNYDGTIAGWRNTNNANNQWRLEQDVAVGTIAFRLCWSSQGATSGCTAYTAPQPFGATHNAIVGLRKTNNGYSSTIVDEFDVVVPGAATVNLDTSESKWGYVGSLSTVTQLNNCTTCAAVWIGDPQGDTWMQRYDDMTTAQLVEKIGIFDPAEGFPEVEGGVVPEELPARPGTEELPTPTTELSPTTNTTLAPPTAPTIPADPTGTHEEQQTGLLQQIKNGITSGLTWLGDKLGGLLSWIGDRILWLGDIFGYWIRWLWERVGQILRAIRDAINSLADLLVYVMTVIRDVLVDTRTAIVSMLSALWSLPEAIVSALQDVLEFLFVPSDDAFDFSDQQAAITASPLGGAIATVGGVPDAFGALTTSCGSVGPEAYGSKVDLCRWSEAGLDFGSGGAMPNLAMRILEVAVWLAVAVRIIRTLPWSKGRDAGEPVAA